MEGHPDRHSEYTKVEQNKSFEEISMAKDIVKYHNDHDLKADEDHLIKEKESINLDVSKGSVSKEETMLGQNNNVQRIGSLHNTEKEKKKSADLKREKRKQTCIYDDPLSEMTLSENKSEDGQDLSVDLKDMNSCVRRPVTQEQDHVPEMHKTVHSEDYEDCINFKIKIGTTDVHETARLTDRSTFVSVRGRKMDLKVLDLLIALKSIFQNESNCPVNQSVLPFEGIQVQRSRRIIICNPQVCDWIQSLTRIILRMQADQGSQGSFIEQWQRGFCFLHEFSSPSITVFNSGKDANYPVVILYFTLCELHMIDVSGKLQSMCVVTTCHVSPDTSNIISSRHVSLPAMSQNDVDQFATRLSIKSSGIESSAASYLSDNLKAVLPLKDKNLDIPELLEQNFNHPHPNQKSHGKQCACRRENCGDTKVQTSSPIMTDLPSDTLQITHHMINRHHEVPKIPVLQEILQPTDVNTKQDYPLKAAVILCEEAMFYAMSESFQPLYSSSRKRCNLWMCFPFEKLPSVLVERRIAAIFDSSHDLSSRGVAYEMKPDMTHALMYNPRQSKDLSFQAVNESWNIFGTNVHGRKEWTSYIKSFRPSYGKSQVDSEKWYLNWSHDHPCFRNRVIVLAIPFRTEALPPRSYIVQNDYRFNFECVRLASFSQYEGSGFRTRFAQAGFVYDVLTRMVVCPWDGSDVTSEIRRNQHTMNCAFVMQFHQINIPLHEAPSPPLPAAFAFDMAATMTSSPATEEQADRRQFQTESTLVASSEETGSGSGQSGEGGNVADFDHIGLTDQEGRYSSFNNSASQFLSNAALEGMISREDGNIETNYTVHHAENSNEDAISGTDEGTISGDQPIYLDEMLGIHRTNSHADHCKICETEPISAVFLPCGHSLFCSECATSFRKCPVCHTLIQRIMSAII